MPGDIVLILSTFPSVDVARTIVRTLVEEKFVACGNLIPGVESIYQWKCEIEAAAEVMGVFKTTADKSSAAMERLRALHPYEVPEILQLPIENGLPAYLQWVRDSVI